MCTCSAYGTHTRTHTYRENVEWKRRIISTQFKLSISLASVSGYRPVTWWCIDYSGPAKSNYTSDLSPINSPHGILTLPPSAARRHSLSLSPPFLHLSHREEKCSTARTSCIILTLYGPLSCSGNLLYGALPVPRGRFKQASRYRAEA